MKKLLVVMILFTQCAQVDEDPAVCLFPDECTRQFDLTYQPNRVQAPTWTPWCAMQREQVCGELYAMSSRGYIEEWKVWYLCKGPGRLRFKCHD